MKKEKRIYDMRTNDPFVCGIYKLNWKMNGIKCKISIESFMIGDENWRLFALRGQHEGSYF